MGALTVCILTKNEDKNIVTAVKNAMKCTSDVLIIDSGSTDRTQPLALEAGARSAFRAWNHDFAAQRNFALTQTDAEWVLYLDADERMNDAMCHCVRQIVKNDAPGQYGMVRHMVFNGYRFRYGIFSPDTVYRLFRRTDVNWVGKVHEHPECSAPKKILEGVVDHYTYDSWHQWLEKADYYTTIWAEERYQKGKRTSLANAFIHAFVGGLRALIIKKAFFDGWMGIISCGQHAFYTMLKYVKLYELQVKNKENI